MEGLRKPFQGVGNIVRFNWPFYAFAFVFLVAMLLFGSFFGGFVGQIAVLIALLAIGAVMVSLTVSWYVYDLSGLYSLRWLGHLPALDEKAKIINIHAGFDETSTLLQSHYPDAILSVFDFYDPAKHTEASIKRARKAYPAYAGTLSIATHHLPVPNDAADRILAVLSAHEIRNAAERIIFFKEMRRALNPGGEIVVVEHLRNMANFLAYNIGFFHFHSRHTWYQTFGSAGLELQKKEKITPFITVFILGKNGTES